MILVCAVSCSVLFTAVGSGLISIFREAEEGTPCPSANPAPINGTATSNRGMYRKLIIIERRTDVKTKRKTLFEPVVQDWFARIPSRSDSNPPNSKHRSDS